MGRNLNRAMKESGGLPEGWNSVKIVSKREFDAKTGTPMVAYKCQRRDKVEGDVVFADTEKAWFKLGMFAKAAGVSEHTLDKFELGDVIGKYVDVLMHQNDKTGYLEAKAFAPFETGGTDEVVHAPPTPAPAKKQPEPVTVPADDSDIPF